MAKRLIDADALKKSLRSNKGAGILGHSIVRLFYLDQLIDEQSAVDAVEVVRCRDCRLFVDNKEAMVTYCRRCLADLTVRPNDFCSYGERKEKCN